MGVCVRNLQRMAQEEEGEWRHAGLHTSKVVPAHGWPVLVGVAAVRGSRCRCTVRRGVVVPLRRSRSGSSMVVGVWLAAISRGRDPQISP